MDLQKILAILTLSLSFFSLLALVDSIPTISISGSKFFDSNGNQFFIRGVAYSPAGVDNLDPLVDASQCALDASLMKILGVNVARVYTVDSSQSHNACMTSFADASIYVLLDLTNPHTSFDRASPDWTLSQYLNFTSTLDAFASYDNLLGVTVANEVVDSSATSDCAPYVKAAARDIKAYRDGQNYRKIPVGYTSADVDIVQKPLADYLACGNNHSDSIDFYGINRYSWCGPSSFEASGYQQIYEEMLDYPIPIFFSETGCDVDGNRTFDDQVAILGKDMNSVWSGAIVYEWAEQENHYGIISYGEQTEASNVTEYASSGTPTPITPDFYNLQSQWDTARPTGIAKSDYTPSFSSAACPSTSSGVWTVDAAVSLPTISGLVISTKTSTSSTSTSSSSGASVTSQAELSTTPTSASSEPLNTSAGLSTGAKIAIGVTIPIVLIAAIAAMIIYLRLRRKKKLSATTDQQYSEVKDQELMGTPVAQLDAEPAKGELGGVPVSQLDAGPIQVLQEPAELDGFSGPQELSAGPSVRRSQSPMTVRRR
ncbi:hypothetical protein MMC12_003055 [Toensbergia leucococca]|nr:hypothetical protein [Toensbergia leucococca]